MGYQNPGTPRFYLDFPSYLKSIGVNYTEEAASTGFLYYYNGFFGLQEHAIPLFKMDNNELFNTQITIDMYQLKFSSFFEHTGSNSYLYLLNND